MGFDISHGKQMISEFSGGHLGSHLGLQLTGPYLESSSSFLNLLGVLIMDQKSNLGDVYLRTGPPHSGFL